MTVAAAMIEASGVLERLRALGLDRVDTLQLTRNRRTMVSIRGRTLRMHRAYADAPEAVHQAVVDFVMVRGGGRGTTRGRMRGGARATLHAAARREIVAWAAGIPSDHRPPRAQHTHPDDAKLAAQVVEWHKTFNAQRFAGALTLPSIRISRRMKARLGHYAPGRTGAQPEIAISWRHLRRNGMADAAQTILHEMVHQWQDENGLPLDHGLAFRKKAREVGVVPRATRRVD